MQPWFHLKLCRSFQRARRCRYEPRDGLAVCRRKSAHWGHSVSASTSSWQKVHQDSSACVAVCWTVWTSQSAQKLLRRRRVGMDWEGDAIIGSKHLIPIVFWCCSMFKIYHVEKDGTHNIRACNTGQQETLGQNVSPLWTILDGYGTGGNFDHGGIIQHPNNGKSIMIISPFNHQSTGFVSQHYSNIQRRSSPYPWCAMLVFALYSSKQASLVSIQPILPPQLPLLLSSMISCLTADACLCAHAHWSLLKIFS